MDVKTKRLIGIFGIGGVIGGLLLWRFRAPSPSQPIEPLPGDEPGPVESTTPTNALSYQIVGNDFRLTNYPLSGTDFGIPVMTGMGSYTVGIKDDDVLAFFARFSNGSDVMSRLLEFPVGILSYNRADWIYHDVYGWHFSHYE